MGIAMTLHQYLNDHQIPFEPVPHARTGSSMDNAEVCQLPRERVAKGVVLKQREGYLLAVVPASRSVSLDDVGGWLHQPVALATEEELAKLFPDCERGAVPPIGTAYGLRSVVDDSLKGKPDIYFEGGDHRTLVHVSGAAFQTLMQNVPHERISKLNEIGESGFPYFGA